MNILVIDTFTGEECTITKEEYEQHLNDCLNSGAIPVYIVNQTNTI